VGDSYDIDGAFKELMQRERPFLLRQLAGEPVVEFLNLELPNVLSRRVDLIARLRGGGLLHVEMQSRNDRTMTERMAVYHTLIASRHGGRVRSVLLYCGEARMRMGRVFQTDQMSFIYDAVDIRQFGAAPLLQSGSPGDCALALLAARTADEQLLAVRWISSLRPPERTRAGALALIFSGLRVLPRHVKMEVANMGSFIDVRKNPILMKWRAEAIREGWLEGHESGLLAGREAGLEEGQERGLEKGQQDLVTSLLVRKFGPLPLWAKRELGKASRKELAVWGERLLDSKTLQEVLRPSSRSRR